MFSWFYTLWSLVRPFVSIKCLCVYNTYLSPFIIGSEVQVYNNMLLDGLDEKREMVIEWLKQVIAARRQKHTSSTIKAKEKTKTTKQEVKDKTLSVRFSDKIDIPDYGNHITFMMGANFL